MISINDRSLDGIHLLEVLPPEVVRQLSTLCGWRRFGRGEQIVGYQDSTRDVFLITRGRVRVCIYTAAGREIVFEDLEAGDHFGELAALDGKTRSASVMALAPTTVACLSERLFLDLCHHHPEIPIQAMRKMGEIVRRFIDRVIDLSTLEANKRVHAELLRLASFSGAEKPPLTIKELPRQAEIAARVGTTRETVARVLADLARKRLIERQGRSLSILAPERLAIVEENEA